MAVLGLRPSSLMAQSPYPTAISLNGEMRRISKLISRLPEFVELEGIRNEAILLLVPDCVPSLPPRYELKEEHKCSYS